MGKEITYRKNDNIKVFTPSNCEDELGKPINHSRTLSPLYIGCGTLKT